MIFIFIFFQWQVKGGGLESILLNSTETEKGFRTLLAHWMSVCEAVMGLIGMSEGIDMYYHYYYYYYYY